MRMRTSAVMHFDFQQLIFELLTLFLSVFPDFVKVVPASILTLSPLKLFFYV